MESLYVKLYDRFNKLKKKKFSEFEEISKDQELKFLKYVNAAEELIEYLRNENDQLRAQVNNLRTEVDSIRSTNNEQVVEYQKLLTEENQKNKALSEEVERLQKFNQERISSCLKDDKNDYMQLNTPEGAQIAPVKLPMSSSKRMTRKRSREIRTERESTIMPSSGGQDGAIAGESEKDLSKETVSSGAFVYDQLPECCKRANDKSGDIHNISSANCLFQALVEYLVGMKLSALIHTDGVSISALHQSSGYSFSLTWIENVGGKESELLYRVVSLGTFERVAPEWMREVLMFSISMCPIFFERIARVIKLHR
ncbi:uncharacterized protein LOC123225407 [Mangifera indica]|uniref:uncharacterized protein LOC123225407 n=1 Tax=Mangifera indica TaxID=29780 RepID=UPI001CFA2566|nr:uncharacterized protein LOC123225407 [Mangifera indica]XP_044505282.1 uncharacterized protein LOC123225407 [Mangifera indica]